MLSKEEVILLSDDLINRPELYNAKDRMILCALYCINDTKVYTHKELASVYGVNKKTIKRRETKLMNILKKRIIERRDRNLIKK